MAKNLVIYYSRRGENYFGGAIRSIAKGNTEYCVEYIQSAVGADAFQVETVKEYAADYMTCTQEAQAESRSGERPELKRYLDSVADYDNIFVCGPCWWGTFPCALLGQLEKLDWTGKNVFALMTHEGSGEAKSRSDLKKFCIGAKVGKTLAVQGSKCPAARETVARWAEKHLK